MNREDFLMLDSNIIYLDNGATTLKPKVLSEEISNYYNKYSANAHRGDYDLSLKVDGMYENARDNVSSLINALSHEIIFTNNCTDSLNKIVLGYFMKNLKPGDEVLLTKSEHASNILPWFELKDKLGINIDYIKLDSDYKVTLDSVKNAITPNTKVISIAYVTNVVGDVRPLKEIISFAHENDILVVVDGAQAVPHMNIDVKDLDIDFLAFSAHKMCGPTGLGILYAKEALLEDMNPIIVGGGMNASFEFDGNRKYSTIPHKFEAGTPNIAGVIGFGAVITYLKKIGMDNINLYERKLRGYAIEKLKTVPNIIIYNEKSDSGIITFNIKGIFAQDTAIYLNKYNIYIRAGSHCAKILKDDLKIKNTCRLSLYFYNTKEEIDKLVSVLSNPNIKNELF